MIHLDNGLLFSDFKKNELSSHKRQEGNLNAICQVKVANLKRYDFNYMTYWKKQKYGDSEKISGWWVGRRRHEQVEHGTFVKLFCSYCNDGYMLYIC